MTDWFRSWHGAPTDPKWLVIARKAGVAPGVVSAVFFALEDYASQHQERGTVEGFDVETYATFTGWDEADIASVIEALKHKGIVSGGRLSAWEKRQPKRERDQDDSSERVKAFRERQRQVTPSNAAKRPEESRVDTDNKETPSLRSGEASGDENLALEIYNEAASECRWPLAQRLTPSRKRLVTLRLAECGGLDGWRNAMARARASPFLRGEGRSNGHENWRPDLDFFLQSKSFTKLMEGAYDHASGNKSDKPHDAILGALASVVARRSGDSGRPPVPDDRFYENPRADQDHRDADRTIEGAANPVAH